MRERGNITLEGPLDRVRPTKMGRRVVIPSNKVLTCPSRPFVLTAHSVREDGKLDDWRGWGEEDDIELRLRAPAGIEKYLHRFRESVL